MEPDWDEINLAADLFGGDVIPGEERSQGSQLSFAQKLVYSLRWLPAYAWQRAFRREAEGNPVHLVFALADHFEPSILPEAPRSTAEKDEQLRRLERWCNAYPKIHEKWRDSAGFPFVHTYFFPAEQSDRSLLDPLVQFCQAGWGEIEVHLHHGLQRPDDGANTRRLLADFRDTLLSYCCLSHLDGDDSPRYAFVHGNWALANSNGGRSCGVDDEMQILADTGCFADLTLPSAPDPSQVSKINSLYECGLDLRGRAPHRRGKNLRAGVRPTIFPLIVQGPLMLSFPRTGESHWLPKIENSALTGVNPASLLRLRKWIQAAITVEGRTDWLFIKLHCHGMDPRDESAMLGEAMERFLEELVCWARENNRHLLHFVTAREMVNIALAACDGKEGNPSDFRDYRFLPFTPRRRP